MLRYDDINEISDGRLYGANDMVKADTGGCAGCSKCCESDMGKTIVLDPYDICNLTLGTGKSFDNLLTDFSVEIGMIDGIALPHLKMDGGCKFLNEDKRCSIHSFRPSICRLFPLGRIYNDKGFDYFLQINECAYEKRTKVKVEKWIGIPDLEKHTAFINKWHRFIKFEKKKVADIRDYGANESARIEKLSEETLREYAVIIGESDLFDEKGPEHFRKIKSEYFISGAGGSIKEVMKTVLAYFYLDGYDSIDTFYEEFDARLRECLAALRKIN